MQSQKITLQQKVADNEPIETTAPKESSTPVAAKRSPRADEPQLQKPEPKVEVNGYNEKSVEMLGDNKMRITLERGGRGKSMSYLLIAFMRIFQF